MIARENGKHSCVQLLTSPKAEVQYLSFPVSFVLCFFSLDMFVRLSVCLFVDLSVCLSFFLCTIAESRGI